MRASLLPLAILAVTTFALASTTESRAGDPTGTWLSQDGDVKMKVSRCGSAICSNIAWLKNPNGDDGKPKVDKHNPDAGKRGRPIMGAPIILSMKPDGADSWSGQIYNAEDGKIYSGSFTLAGGNKADLKGCFAIICKTKSWARSN